MVNRVKSYMEKQNMISAGDTIWVALSGGPDSVALLLILSELAEELSISLKAIHVEHGIRGEESRQDARFVADLCRDRKIPLTTKAVDVPAYAKEKGLGLEEAARILRYGAFEEVCGDGKVALAHHKNDQMETMLFQLARGTGIDGLCGMAPLRREKDLTLIRPLLCLEREEIETYLKKKGQAYCTDSTNADTDYSRNRIRSRVLPELEQINSAAVRHFSESAEQLSQIRDFLQIRAGEAFEKCLLPQESNGEKLVFSIDRLREEHPALQNEIYRMGIGKLVSTKKDITETHIAGIAGLLEKQSGRRISLPYGIVAVREQERLILGLSGGEEGDAKELPPEEISEDRLKDLLESGELYRSKTFPELAIQIEFFKGDLSQIPKNSYTFWLDYDRLKSGFSLRSRRDGDWFYLNEGGDKKMLSRYFIDNKIPESCRDYIPVLACDDHVLWVDGRTCSSAYVGPQTKIILEIRKEQ